MTKELVLYGRSECHLCHDMQEELRALSESQEFTVKVIDIDANPDLETRFGHKIPVLMIGDQEICHYVLDAASLFQYLNDNTA
jgi:glutaredoxin